MDVQRIITLATHLFQSDLIPLLVSYLDIFMQIDLSEFLSRKSSIEYPWMTESISLTAALESTDASFLPKLHEKRHLLTLLRPTYSQKEFFFFFRRGLLVPDWLFVLDWVSYWSQAYQDLAIINVSCAMKPCQGLVATEDIRNRMLKILDFHIRLI